MRIEQFEYLLAIEKHGTILSAAQELFISPQAISISITSLEKELGLKLVDRNRKGTFLTSNGKIVADSAQEFIQKLNLCKQNSNANLLYGNYELPIMHTFGALQQFFPKFAKQLAELNPDFHIKESGLLYSEAVNAVATGIRSYILIYQLSINGTVMKPFPEDCSYTPIFSAKLYCMMPDSFKDSQKTHISIAETSRYPVALLSAEMDSPFALFIAHQHDQENIYHVHDLFHQSTFVASQKAIDYTWVSPFRTIANTSTYKYIPVTDNIQLTYGILKKASCDLPEQDARFLECLSNFVNSSLNIISNKIV